MKKHCLAVFFGLAALIAIAFTAMAQTPSIPQWSDIPEKAMTADGMARIIVQVDVPDIDALTKASTSMHLPQDKDDNARAAREAMARADAALTRAVSAATREVLASLPGSSHRINRQYRFLPFVALDVAPDAFLVLQSNPRVTAISFDIPTPLPGHGPTPPSKSTPTETSPPPGDNDPARPSMDDTISLIGADKAWAKGYSGSGWYVAILDTGIRRTHQFFQGKTIEEACFSSNANCPNGQTSMTGTGAAAHYPSTYDGYDHGTHVAGTAAGNKPDGTLFGVARDADIIAVNVFSRFTAEECGGSPCVMSYDSDQLAGIEFVYALRGTHNIGAGNMSLGGGQYSSYCDSVSQKSGIDLLRSANIPVAISTGNEGYCGYISSPACVSTAYPVMATTKNDIQASFNNWSAALGDIFAPGVSILSATGDSDTSYARWGGTSMATPHMTGAFTLMRQYQPGDAPDAHFSRLTQLGPSITTPCAGGGSKPRLYVDNFTGTSDVWKTEIGIVNLGSSVLTGTLYGFDANGATVWNTSVSIPALGRSAMDVSDVAGSAAGSIKYMELDISSGMAVGYQKFYQSGKYRVGLEALTQATQNGLYVPHIHSDENWWTGFGLVSTTGIAKNLGFTFSDGTQATQPLGGSEHKAFLASDLLGDTAFQGSATVSDGIGIVGLLLFGSEKQLSGVSLSDNTSHQLVFPHLDQGNNWWTGLGVYNPGNTQTNLTLKAYDTHGNLLQTWSDAVLLDAYQRYVSTTTMPTGTAWFTVDAQPEPVIGFQLFGRTSQDRLAGFNVVDLATEQGVFPKIEKSGWTGIALVNVGSITTSITLEARDDAGSAIATRSLSLAAGAKVVDLAENMFPGQNIDSATYVRFISDQSIVGFQLNGSSDDTMLDAVPALGSSANMGTSSLYFPHIDAQ